MQMSLFPSSVPCGSSRAGPSPLGTEPHTWGLLRRGGAPEAWDLVRMKFGGDLTVPGMSETHAHKSHTVRD